jgi:hypothetical protein
MSIPRRLDAWSLGDWSTIADNLSVSGGGAACTGVAAKTMSIVQAQRITPPIRRHLFGFFCAAKQSTTTGPKK